MKLTTLLKPIETIDVSEIKVQGAGHYAKGNGDSRDALYLVPDADLPDVDIGSIHHRAQEVTPGGLFVAVKGQTADGHDFIDQALGRGAVAVVAQQEIDPSFFKGILEGQSWLPLATDLNEPAYTFHTGQIPVSNNALIRVIATDGFHTAVDESDAPFSLAANLQQH